MTRLYVLVRKDLPPAQQAVQACHAVAEYLLSSPDPAWKNQNLVLLHVPDEAALWALWKRACEYYTGGEYFLEPDLNDQLTAVCIVENKHTKAFTRGLPLLELSA